MKILTNNDFWGMDFEEVLATIRNEVNYVDAFDDILQVRFSRMYAGNDFGRAIIGDKWVKENMTVEKRRDCTILIWKRKKA